MRAKKLTFDELVDREAKAIALGRLEAELEKEGFPLPKESALDVHLNQMILLDPSLRELAAARVEAKSDAYSESLRAIGLGLDEPTEAVEIDL